MKRETLSPIHLLIFSIVFTILLNIPAFAQPHDPQILLNPTYRTPSFISEHWKNPQITNKREMIWSYLAAKKSLFRLGNNVQSHFRILKEEKDEFGYTHFRLQQIVNGIKVYGADQTIHLNKQNQVTSYLGQFIPELEQKNLPTTPQISVQTAKKIATNDLKIKDRDASTKTELWIYPFKHSFYLAYEVKISTIYPKPGYWHYYINGIDGKIIHKYDAIQPIKGDGKGVLGDKKTFEITCDETGKPCFLYDQTRGKGIKTHDAQNKNYNDRSLPGPLISSPSTTFNEPAGVDAHTYLSKSYDYFKDHFGRNSYDNKGTTIISSVHVGNQWNNAAWNGKYILFGDGDGQLFGNFAAGLDVSTHELTHAITETTARLQYWGEPGALNESISDIFAVMVDPDWLIGEDIYTPNIPNDALRSIKDPTQFKQPDHYRNRYIGFEDNGGVHINSGINNKAAYLLMDGGTHHGITVDKIGKQKTALIYYRTLTHYLTSSSNFSLMRQAAIQAAKDLYGENSTEVNAVVKAYDAVGIN